MMELAGKTAVITGASRGLGAGLARDFARRGMRLGLCARSRPVQGVSRRVPRSPDHGAQHQPTNPPRR